MPLNLSKSMPLSSNVFSSIKDLPYIAVLDAENKFYGILTHTRLMDMLSQSWNVSIGSYVVTVVSPGTRGDLVGIAKIIYQVH